MNAVRAHPTSKSGLPVAGLARQLIEAWLSAFREFRAWERAEIIEKAPSDETLADYGQSLKIMLRMARALQAQVTDADFPAHEFIPQINGTVLQLESSWESLINPLTEEEADGLLQKYFPQDPLTKRLASR